MGMAAEGLLVHTGRRETEMTQVLAQHSPLAVSENSLLLCPQNMYHLLHILPTAQCVYFSMQCAPKRRVRNNKLSTMNEKVVKSTSHTAYCSIGKVR